MKLLLLAAAAVALSGCATADQKAFYADIQGCQRHYIGSVSAGGVIVAPGFSGSIDVTCEPLAITKANAAKIKADAPAGVVPGK